MISKCTNRALLLVAATCALASCSSPVVEHEYYGTLEPFASEAVYFVVTDRFVDGDPANNHEKQGGDTLATFDRPVQIEGLPPGNIGYLGGDFRGVLDNADYIADMGFSAIWLTPIVDNPDEAFTGGMPPGAGGSNDQGKTGYHGYWGVNFFEVDEHLESAGLHYADLTRGLLQDHGLKTILDIVVNHGSPAFSMPIDQPKYGEIYDADGRLVADHQNLLPSELEDNNPLHAFYRHERDLAELADMDYNNPDVLEYFVAAHSKWIGQGAAALRIDTIKHMPHSFWKAFSDRIRERRPGLFMFAEAWSFDPEVIAEFTYPEHGGISVLDFPGQQAMSKVFSTEGGPYSALLAYLELDSGIYENPYELMTFYDNHDMPRMHADANGFIDANNWLFTSRGIPVVYYGSEIGFRAGTDQHSGNRDYFGQENIEQARSSPIRSALRAVAGIRKTSIALQRGLQVNLDFDDETAAFYRVYGKEKLHQTALVLLNKGDDPVTRTVSKWLSHGDWLDAASGETYNIDTVNTELDLSVAAHGVRVMLFDGSVNDVAFISELDRLKRHTNRE